MTQIKTTTDSGDKWHKRYLSLAKEVSYWSKDPSKKIGAVIVGKAGQIVSLGYNGFPRNVKDSPERLSNKETKLKLVVHAEMNAIYNAIHNNASTVGCTMYVTGLPICSECAKGIIQVGITTVVMDTKPEKGSWKESGKLAIKLFKEAGVKIKYIKD